MAEPLLEVKNLSVHFPTDDGIVKAVDGVSLSLAPGETLGVVGESGSGKSVTFLTLMGLVTSKQANISGTAMFKGQDLLTMPTDELRTVRGAQISMIFQDPMTSLHPYYKVGQQIAEAILAHGDVSKSDAWDQAVDMLRAAAVIFEDCGALLRRQEALDALARLGTAGKRAAAAARGPESLTRRERDVAALAAAGLPAKEIGRRLFIGERTVEGHLARAYTKLGVRSKSELAERAGELGLATDA